MGWITVETPNAIYKVVLETHLRDARLPIDVDATVVEMIGNISTVIKSLEKGGIYKETREENMVQKPVFHGDFSSEKKIARIFLKGSASLVARSMTLAVIAATISPSLFLPVGGLGMASMVSHAGLVPGREIKKRKVALPFLRAINQVYEGNDPLVTYRNALIAEKAEARIAPHLFQRLGRKPTIAIVYGAAHADIARLLSKPAERRRILRRKNLRKVSIDAVIHTTELTYNSKKKGWDFHDLDKLTIPSPKRIFKPTQARLRLAGIKIKRMMKRRRP